MTDDLRRIRRFITALTWRERGLLLLRVALYAALVGIGVEIVAVLAASGRWHRPTALGLVVLLAGIGGWLAVVVPLVLRWRRTGDALRQARLVEEMAPGLRGRLLTAVERTDGPRGQESEALLGLIARKAAREVDEMRPRAVHPARSVARLAAATLLVGLVGLVVAAVAPGGPVGTAQWWLAGSDAKAAAAGLVFEAEEDRARVGDLVLRYTYPDYTGLDPVEVNNSTGDAHGPPGTTVRVVAKSATPVEAAALVAYDQPALDAEVGQGGRTLSGSFTIDAAPGFYHLVTYQGGEPKKSRDFSITPEPDLPPDVTLDLEDEVLRVAVDEPIAFGWRARDDYGIGRVTLTLDGRPDPKPLAAPRQRKAEVVGQLGTRPFQLGLSPGDQVTLKVVAWDNDTYSGSKPGASRGVRIEVLGPRGLDLREAERQEVLRDRMLTVLADHLEEPWPVSRSQEGLATWGQELAQRYEPLDEAIEEYWTGVVSESLEATIVDRVQRTGRELIRHTQIAYLPNETTPAPTDDLEVTAGLRDEAVVALEDGILALDRMVTMRALRHLAEDAQQLATAAQNLQEMMEGDPEAQELLSRLDRLEMQMRRMMESASRMQEGGLKEFVNQREAEMKSLMDEIREAIAEGRMDDAREMMERLARQVEQMSEGIQDNLQRMVSEEGEAMEMAQGLEQRLQELEDKQLALQEQVRELRQQSDAESAEEAEDLWQEVERRSEAVSERGERYVEDLEKAGRGFNEEEVARNAADQLDHLSESAAARDLNGLEQAIAQSRVEWHRVEARRELMEAMAGGKLDGPGRRETRRIQRDLEELAELVQRLEQLSQQVSPQTREQVREQRQQQQELQQDLQSARESAREMSRQFPVRPEGMQESLEDADQQMGQASDDLERGQPMQAEGAQEMAAQGLRDARESLRRAMEQARRQQMQLQPRGEQGEQARREGQRDGQADPQGQIELPSPEEFRTPEEYRRALLEGMEGDVPEEYRALKKRYYEELVHQ